MVDAIDLSHEAPFRLGILEVRPATRQVIHELASETLEPRVMQVLVALARANGAVVSRGDLIDSCWNGRIVGENAINRVISRIRNLASRPGRGSFELETITKVGYRLIVANRASEGDASESPAIGASPTGVPLSRRAMIAIAATAVGGSGALAWLVLRRHQPPAAAVVLYHKGLEAQKQGLPDQTVQAITFLKEAVAIDPDYADAWGALAISYRHRLENDPTVDANMVAGWVRGAAERALRLDPANADGQIAKILIPPHFRNWAAVEGDYRRTLAEYPNHWLLRGTFGRLMYSVGRWNEGIDAFRKNVAADPFLPISQSLLAEGYWGAGRLQEAERTIETAISRWPAHPSIWFLRFNFLAHTGRPAAAIAFAGDVEARPYGIPDSVFARNIGWARAIETRAQADIDPVVATAFASARQNVASIPGVVPVLAAFGRGGDTFDLLDRYYLNIGVTGSAPAPIGRLTRRDTVFLFAQPAAPIRADPRFEALTRAIGLEDYWRIMRTSPDYRT